MVEAFEDRVAGVLRRLLPGDVVAYGDVAAEAGSPGAARAVGNLLRRGLPDVPWWRVVRADGGLSCPNRSDQIARLRAEGVVVRAGRVQGWRARPGGTARSPSPASRRSPTRSERIGRGAGAATPRH